MNNYIKQIIREEVNNVLNEVDDQDKKSVNEEFEVSDYGLTQINTVLEKVNKNLKTRNKTQLELEILNTEERMYKKDLPFSRIPLEIPYNVNTIIIKGDIPDIHDYEFIAKIEHTLAGNIINMNPNVPKENLPAEYRTFDQRCDVCGTKRERNNTFILKKVETDELMVAGSTCLKKFLPLDAVKAMLNLGIQLEVLRSELIDIELQGNDDEGKLFGTGGGTGGGRIEANLNQKEMMYFICLEYLDNNKFFITKTKANETGQIATVWGASRMREVEYGFLNVKEDEKKRIQEIGKEYGKEADKLSSEIMAWVKKFDFDEAMVKNPNFAEYYNNLKVITNLPSMEYRHLGYFSSLLPMYFRETKPKQTINKSMKKESDYVGVVGDKIVDHEVKYVRSSQFDGPFGVGYIVVFEDTNGNTMIWFTSSYKSVEKIKSYVETDENRKFKITGMVKQHKTNDFRGTTEKQTILKNVKLNLGK